MMKKKVWIGMIAVVLTFVIFVAGSRLTGNADKSQSSGNHASKSSQIAQNKSEQSSQAATSSATSNASQPTNVIAPTESLKVSGTQAAGKGPAVNSATDAEALVKFILGDNQTLRPEASAKNDGSYDVKVFSTAAANKVVGDYQVAADGTYQVQN
ncbi:hypothetical protein SAMN05660469_0766 [Fructobacillus pseudoficulneus]|nr:hypothetical protein SAMN05660469_0766 [Fructobacillus pseudoficulneus]